MTSGDSVCKLKYIFVFVKRSVPNWEKRSKKPQTKTNSKCKTKEIFNFNQLYAIIHMNYLK